MTAPRLYLASASPRRTELLDTLRIAHRVLRVPSPPGEDEPRHPGESPQDYVCRTAHEKAQRGHEWMRQQGLAPLPVLSADTCVSLDDTIFGKPADRGEAERILASLSGTCHQVRTAVALHLGDRVLQTVCTTRVWMKPLSAEEIRRYCDSGEPFGKAGAYGIQGLAGAFVSRLEGSYTGVMGLPLYETAQLLAEGGLGSP